VWGMEILLLHERLSIFSILLSIPLQGCRGGCQASGLDNRRSALERCRQSSGRK
jgi:hypothetical protein